MNLPTPLQRATFLRRLNRFAAEVRVNGVSARAHVANSGRLGELLTSGTEAHVHPASNPDRITSFDLVLVRFGEHLVSVDSRAPAAIGIEALREGRIDPVPPPDELRREVAVGDGRIDAWLRTGGEEWFIEMKGCTLVRSGTAIFPDAPTARGRRHLNELSRLVCEGRRAMVLFVIQRSDAREFRPNVETDPDFALALREAREAGVVLRAHWCHVTLDSVRLGDAVPVHLDGPLPPPEAPEA